MALSIVNNDQWALVLSRLIKSGLKDSGLETPDAAAVRAKKLFPDGEGAFSSKSIHNYRSQHVKKLPNREYVERLASIFGKLPEDWVRQVFPDDNAKSLLRAADTILKTQSLMKRGDSVTIISARPFLESSRVDVANAVVSNLARRVRYSYYFPLPGSGPHGDEACRSFAKFMAERVNHGAFEQSPQIFGFAVDSARFPYFTPICSLVRFKSMEPGLTQCYGYIEIVHDSGFIERKWYAIEDSVWKKIEGALDTARSPVSESIVPIHALNPQLKSIATVYTKWFSTNGHVKEYRELRPVLGHTGDACVQHIGTTLATHALNENPIRLLDIGCGDGEITARIATTLAPRNVTHIVGIDVSESQIEAARTTLKSFSPKPELSATSFENFTSKTPFHVITAIHSTYVVDEAYLRRLFHLLAPGGIALIWMASGKQNIVHALTEKLDQIFWHGQRRNTAEDILESARLAGLSPQFQLSECPIPSLLDENGSLTRAAGQLVDYCALKEVDRKSREWKAAAELIKHTVTELGKHPLNDLLITIKRRPA